MFKRTLTKLNNINTITPTPTQSIQSHLLEKITSIKKTSGTVFGAIYTTHSRHTVYKPVEAEDTSKRRRRSAFDYINNFTSVVLPKIEEFVEARLMEKFKANLTVQERSLVDDVYRQRLHLKSLGREAYVDKPLLEEATKIMTEEKDFSFLDSPDGTGFRFHDESSIGKYTAFPKEKWEELFPFGSYGDYINQEYSKTKLHSIMCREESLRLANGFKFVTTHEERLKLIDFENILNKNFDFKTELKNEETFSLFFAEFAYSILKVLDTMPFEYKYCFTNPEMFDGLTTVLVMSLKNSQNDIFLMTPSTRFFMIKHIITKIYEVFGNKVLRISSTEIKEKELKITQRDLAPFDDFYLVIEHFKLFSFDFDYKYVKEFADGIGVKLNSEFYTDKLNDENAHAGVVINLAHHKERSRFAFRPESMRFKDFKGHNTGVLLHGEGNGKSMILAYLHAWAKESGWFVLPVNDVKKYTQGEFPIERHLSGIYFQPELAVHFLRDVKIVNYELLKNTKVLLDQYGKFNIAGIKDGDPEPNPVLWDERSQTYTDSWSEWNAIPEEEIVAEDHPDHGTRLRDVLAKPRTLMDIVEQGIANERVATCAVFELLHQLSISEYTKTMFLVDDYLELFKPTVYDSYKYANFRDYQTKIPPHDIALPRMFMKFDGHLMKQGVKVMAISLREYDGHKFVPKKINFPKGYHLAPENLTLNETRNYVDYLYAAGGGLQYSELDCQDLWTNSSGNWKHMQLDMKYWFKEEPSLSHYMMRKAKRKIVDEGKKF